MSGSLAGAPTTFGVRVVGRGLALVAAIVLARVLGVEGYGVYAYALAFIAILNVPSVLGFPQLLLRQVAVYEAHGQPDLTRGLIRYAHRFVVPVSLGLVTVAAAVAALFVDRLFLPAVLIALAIVPLQALTALRAGVLQGLGRAELSFLPVFVIFPIGLVSGVLGARALGVEVTPQLAVGIAGAATLAGLAFAALAARHYLRPLIAGAGLREDTAAWRGALGAFSAVAVITAVASNIGLLLLGQLGTAGDVGVMRVAMRLSEPVVFVFTAITVTAAPKLARLHATGEREQLGTVARRASRASLYWSLPIAAVLIGGQGWLLDLFGEGFGGGGTALTILVGSALFNAFAGSVGNVLLMTGHGRAVAWAKGAGLGLDIVLALTLIPILGVTGAAIARAADLVLWNSILAVVVWRRLGFNATAAPWPLAR